MSERWDDLVEQIRQSQSDVRFSELCRLCDHFFGRPRQVGSSHRIYRTPWEGDPRINIQNDNGKAKVYQVRQVLAAISKLKTESEHGK